MGEVFRRPTHICIRTCDHFIIARADTRAHCNSKRPGLWHHDEPPHTITVTDPQPATASTPTSPPQTIVTDPSIGTGSDHGWWGQHRNSIANGGTTTPATWTSTGLAGQSSALFSQIGDLVADRGVANSASAPIDVANVPRANGSTASSLVNHTFALLNQYLASDTGRIDPGQIVAAGPNRAPWAQEVVS